MVIFHCYVSLPEGNREQWGFHLPLNANGLMGKSTEKPWFLHRNMGVFLLIFP